MKLYHYPFSIQDFATLVPLNDIVSPFYTPDMVEYSLAYTQYLEKDLSILVKCENRLVAFCPLFLESSNGVLTLSYGSFYQRAPWVSPQLSQKETDEVYAFLFHYIDTMADEHNAKACHLMLDPLTAPSYNYLQKYGYLDTSIQTQIVDVTVEESELFKHVRKGHKSNIKAGLKHYTLHVMDHTNADYDFHEEYRQLHHKAAGKVTRPKSTFDKQFDMVKNNVAILIGLQYKDDWIGFSHFLHSPHAAYYGSFADDPDATDLPAPIGHCILWTAINYYRDHDHKQVEIGWQQFSAQFTDSPTSKDYHIAKFKRGFGGTTKPVFRGIKYYDADYASEELNKASKAYINAISASV